MVPRENKRDLRLPHPKVSPLLTKNAAAICKSSPRMAGFTKVLGEVHFCFRGKSCKRSGFVRFSPDFVVTRKEEENIEYDYEKENENTRKSLEKNLKNSAFVPLTVGIASALAPASSKYVIIFFLPPQYPHSTIPDSDQ